MKLKAIYINETNKEGNPLINKNGKQYTNVVIMTEDGTRASNNIYMPEIVDRVRQWTPGYDAPITIAQNGGFTNWEFVKKNETKPAPVSTDTKSNDLERRVAILESQMRTVNEFIQQKALQSKQEDFDVDQIPF